MSTDSRINITALNTGMPIASPAESGAQVLEINSTPNQQASSQTNTSFLSKIGGSCRQTLAYVRENPLTATKNVVVGTLLAGPALALAFNEVVLYGAEHHPLLTALISTGVGFAIGGPVGAAGALISIAIVISLVQSKKNQEAQHEALAMKAEVANLKSRVDALTAQNRNPPSGTNPA